MLLVSPFDAKRCNFVVVRKDVIYLFFSAVEEDRAALYVIFFYRDQMFLPFLEETYIGFCRCNGQPINWFGLFSGEIQIDGYE